MELTKHQQDMLDGKYGKGKAMALQIQVAIGEGFQAARMVPITRAHVALSAQEADTWFAGKLRDAGAVCAISPTVNPGYCLEHFKRLRYVDDQSAALMRETHQVYQDLGATLTYSCTPYLFGNIPRFGEVVSFSETSVSVYANSVLGAKTHRESSASSLCAAVTGYVPEYGVLLDRNRYGEVLVEVAAKVESDFDYALLGLTAKKIGDGIPVFTGLGSHISTEALIALGTQLNVAGVCDLYHIVGVTPQAATVERAFGGNAPRRWVRIDDADLEEQRQRLWGPSGQRSEFVMLGCPHYTYQQLCRVAELLGEGQATIPIWILTSSAVIDLARHTGLLATLEGLGVSAVPDTCVDQSACWGHLAGRAGVTDSPKCAYYMHAFGVELAVWDVADCMHLAVSGGGEA